MLRPLACAAALFVATAAPAAPLCRDSKGAFTPCTPNQTRQIVRKAHEEKVRIARDHPSATAATTTAATASAAPAKPRKAPLVTRSRLCRDSKGLFTPCPR